MKVKKHSGYCYKNSINGEIVIEDFDHTHYRGIVGEYAKFRKNGKNYYAIAINCIDTDFTDFSLDWKIAGNDKK